MFPSGHEDSAGEAGTREKARGPGKDLCPARGERSERPVAGPGAVAQADQAGRPPPGRHRARKRPARFTGVPAGYGRMSTVGQGNRMRVAAEVADLLSAGDLETLRQSAATGYRCLACGQHDQLAAGPVSVVVRLATLPGTGPGGPQVAHVGLAHARCSPSQVIAGADSSPEPAETMRATAAVLPDPGRRALLITEPSVRMSSRTSSGERVDPVLAGLLGRGLHLLASIEERAPGAPGWLVSLPSPAEAVIREPDGSLFYAGELDQPRKWRQLTSRRGQVELLTGVIGFRGAGEGSPDEGLAVLASAAQRGRLIGATVAVG